MFQLIQTYNFFNRQWVARSKFAHMSAPIIKAKDLRKIYQVGTTKVKALDGVDVEIEKGAYIA